MLFSSNKLRLRLALGTIKSVMQKLYSLIASIQPVLAEVIQQAKERQNQLTKPSGALGELEHIGIRLAGVFGTPQPHPQGVAVLVAAGDHGVANTGVSAYPPEVTPAMIENFLADTPMGLGGAAINALARTIGAQVYVMNAGINADLPEHPQLVQAAVRKGTRNLHQEAAMTETETLALIQAGATLAQQAIEAGADVIIPGEMGIGNTTPAAAITARLLDLEPAQVTGRGTGINDQVLQHKTQIITEALQRSDTQEPIQVLAEFGGFEIAAMLGMILQTAAMKRAILLDGFVEGSAALVAVKLTPHLRDYLFAAGECAEIGHHHQLQHLGLKPMFNLGLRLGEGTGGVLAAPMLLSAAATLREMQTFEKAGVPKA